MYEYAIMVSISIQAQDRGQQRTVLVTNHCDVSAQRHVLSFLECLTLWGWHIR